MSYIYKLFLLYYPKGISFLDTIGEVNIPKTSVKISNVFTKFFISFETWQFLVIELTAI